MNYIYDYISEERKKEIADMNIVDTYNRTGYLDIPGDKVVKSKDEYFLFWYKTNTRILCVKGFGKVWNKQDNRIFIPVLHREKARKECAGSGRNCKSEKGAGR